jgi:hypothetical protein
VALRTGSGGKLRTDYLAGIGVAPPLNNQPNPFPQDNDRSVYPDESMFFTGGGKPVAPCWGT